MRREPLCFQGGLQPIAEPEARKPVAGGEAKPPDFASSNGLRAYGAFTVSASSLDQVRTYVLRQQEHHATTTFQQEYVAMLQRGLVRSR